MTFSEPPAGPLDADALARLRKDLALGQAEDATFDALYAASIQARSSRFWTPLKVATRAARLFAQRDVRRVLDVGSGSGKFCLTAAAVCPDLDFTGIEQRPHLVEAARLAAARLQLENARFLVGAVTDLPWPDLDGLYLYNPFAENVSTDLEIIDDTVELSTPRYMSDVRFVGAVIRGAPVGTCMVTYHGFGGPIPVSYDLVHAERAHTDWLRVWVKKREQGDGRTCYVEDGDDLLIVSSVSGKTVTERVRGVEVE